MSFFNNHLLGHNTNLALPFPFTLGTVGGAVVDGGHADAWTFEAWVYVEAYANPPAGAFTYTGSDTMQTLLLTSGPNGYSGFIRLIGGGKPEIYNYKTGTAIRSTVAVTAQAWVHAAITFDNSIAGPANNTKIYQNGALTGEGRFSNNFYPIHTLFVGHVDSNRAANNLYGKMDEMRIWRGARTATEIANNFRLSNKSIRAQINSTNMVSCYSYNDPKEGTIPSIKDGSGNNYHLKASTNSWEQTPVISTAPLIS